MKPGKVILIGAGPGDPGLLTIKGRDLLSQADTVVYDRLVGPGVLSLIPPAAKRIDVGKQAGYHPIPQQKIHSILMEEALQGKLVIRLKGGDPFVFGRGGEELEALASLGIPWEVVPGITSAIAVPAYAGIPATHREVSSSLHLITAHAKEGSPSLDYPTLAALTGTLIFFMGVAALPSLCQGLIGAGMSPQTPAAALENGTTAFQRNILSTLEELPEKAREQNIQSPTLIVIGQVCSLSPSLSWTEFLPLHGMRILVCRPQKRISSLSSKLSRLGAEVIEYPSIQIQERPLSLEIKETLLQLSRYSWVVFTSAAGVTSFFQSLFACHLDIRALSHASFAAIGPATAGALADKGILADYMPDHFYGTALAEGLCSRLTPQDQVLIPRASQGSRGLTKILERHGIAFTDLALYDTEPVLDHPVSLLHLEEGPCYVAFTSASTVRGFVSSCPQLSPQKFHAVCIGEQTAEEARRFGFCCTVSPEASLDSMVDCFCTLASQKRKKET